MMQVKKSLELNVTFLKNNMSQDLDKTKMCMRIHFERLNLVLTNYNFKSLYTI